MLTKLLGRFFVRPRRMPQPVDERKVACPACGQGIIPVLFEATREQRILICSACRHMYWDRMPSQEDLLRYYETDYHAVHNQPALQEGARAYYQSHAEELVSLSGRKREDICLVDYGSSIPTFVHEAHKVGVGRAIAVEVGRTSWEYAQQHGLAIMTPAQYSKQLPPGSVDVIRFCHVLEHLPSPQGAIAEAVGKLRPGGLLYVTQPNFPVFKVMKTDHQLKDSVYPGHLHFFSPISLLAMVVRYGLEIMRFYTVGRHDEVFAEMGWLMDVDYAREKLVAVMDKGELCRGEKANYPFYAGENSALYTRKAV